MKDKYNIFIDGSAGTTGLRIKSLLEKRRDITVSELTGEKRKDIEARLSCAAGADLTVLCLPDTEAAAFVETASADMRIIDASTAHRTRPDWVYGLPELTPCQRESIAKSNRVAVPGCHATGFILMARPLLEAGIVPKSHVFAVHSVTGYSGGGKAMISEYEQRDRAETYSAPRQYALSQTHKHLPEMKLYAGTYFEPLFVPHVADYYSGIEVVIALSVGQLIGSADAEGVRAAIEEYYANESFVSVRPLGSNPEDGFLSANAYADRNDVEIFINGNDNRITLTARYDNLGKGASGAAAQCMNIMLGIDERKGLFEG